MTTLAGATSLNEWLSRVNGFIQGCGEAGALVIAHMVNGEPISTDQLTATIQAAVNAHESTTSGGAQTISQVSWDLSQAGVPNTINYPTAGGLGSFLNAQIAAGRPVELGVLHGGALTGDPSGLGGHFVDIVGQNANGSYQVADPNTAASQSGQLVTDTLAQLQSAGVFGAVTPNAAAGSSGSSGGSTLLAAQTGATSTGSALNPQTWISDIQTALTGPLQRYGLVVFGGLLLLVGVLIVFFSQPSTQRASGEAAETLVEAAA